MKKKNNLLKLLTTIGLLLILGSLVGGLAILSNGFTSAPKQFYLRQGDKTFLGNCDNFTVVQNRVYRFEIVNTYTDNDDYTIAITPNVTAETNFSFKVDGETKNFADVDSLMKGFEMSVGAGYFTLKANGDQIQDILALCYPGQTVTDVPVACDNGTPYFKLTVSTKDKKSSIEINFNLKTDPDEIIPVDPDNTENLGNIGDLPDKPVDLDKYL